MLWQYGWTVYQECVQAETSCSDQLSAFLVSAKWGVPVLQLS
jgi:hypothetical protein